MNNKRVFLFALIAVSLGLNIYFRLNTLFLWSLDKKAKKEVHVAIVDKLYKEINLVYSGLGEADKVELLESAFKLYLKENKAEVKKAIFEKSQGLKAYYRDKDGWTYMQEVDPYRWYRRVDNFLKNGNFGTVRINNQDYDTLMLAPFGAKIEPLKLHFYIGAYFYRFVHFINNKLSLMSALSFLPVLLSVFLVIAVFSIALMLGVSHAGSFVASLAVGLSPVILMRSSFGWFDTDIYNIFLPLFIAYLAAYSFKVKGLKHILFLFLAGLTTGVYSAIWSIWWFIFYIIAAGLFLHELCMVSYDPRSSKKAKIKDAFLSLALFILSTYLWVGVISGPEAIAGSFSGPFSILSTRQNLAIANFWPNMAFSIQELNSSGVAYIRGGLGGGLILCGGLLGILVLIIKKRVLVNFSEKSFLLFVLTVWLLVMLILTSLSKRFIIFLAVPIGIFFGAFLDTLRDFMYRQKDKIIFLRKINEKAYITLLSGIFLAGAILPIRAASREVFLPILNNTWQHMLIKIKNVTPPDAVISAYWDPGDFIMSVSGRATLHCPQYNFTPVAYWTARLFMSDNEKEALGILRMLNAGNTQGFEELLKLTGGEKLAAFELINKMLLCDKYGGRSLLSRYTDDKKLIDKILGLIYEPKHPAYLLVDGGLLNMVEVFCTLANWDFKKLDLWQNMETADKVKFTTYAGKKFGYSKAQAESLYQTMWLTSRKRPLDWISSERYRLYSSGLAQRSGAKDEKIIRFNNGLLVDKDNSSFFYRQDMPQKWIIPGEIVLVTKDRIKEKALKGDSEYSLLFLESKDTYEAILMDKRLARSMLIKLYFMKGKGLKYFQLIEQEENKETGLRIYLYKINWSAK
ncbi:MAG: STT3 domain-containing protein [Candidatus Omnitrophica bacterium]|nr:STT3 domain-containing protein [Candidatus Omnitrophota bacterium]